MQLADMTWQTAHEELKRSKVVLLPVGAFEAHGAHLPLSTDADTAQEVASRAGRKANVPVAPLLPIGQSEHLSRFPGTITFSSPTYRLVITEVCESLFRAGADRILVVNGHGGNNRILQDTLSTIEREHEGHRGLALIHCLGVLGQIWPKVKGKNIGHSDFREASIMLAVKPTAVHLQRAQQPEVVRYQLSENAIGRHGFSVEHKGATVFVPRPVEEWAPNCGWGQLDESSPQLGEEILETISDYVASFVEEFRQFPLSTGRAA